MTGIAHAAAGRKPLRSPVFNPPQADRHRELPRRIRRLGTGSRYDAIERFIIEKLTIAREVELLGDELAEGER